MLWIRLHNEITLKLALSPFANNLFPENYTFGKVEVLYKSFHSSGYHKFIVQMYDEETLCFYELLPRYFTIC